MNSEVWASPRRSSLPSSEHSAPAAPQDCANPPKSPSRYAKAAVENVKIKAMAVQIVQPSRALPAIRPKVQVRPEGIRTIAKTERRFESGLGLAKGCAEFALKNPPPLVPRSCAAVSEATGPSGIRSPESDAGEAVKVCGTPQAMKRSPKTKERGRITQTERRTRSAQKLPTTSASLARKARMRTSETANPVAQEAKF